MKMPTKTREMFISTAARDEDGPEVRVMKLLAQKLGGRLDDVTLSAYDNRGRRVFVTLRRGKECDEGIVIKRLETTLGLGVRLDENGFLWMNPFCPGCVSEAMEKILQHEGLSSAAFA